MEQFFILVLLLFGWLFSGYHIYLLIYERDAFKEMVRRQGRMNPLYPEGYADSSVYLAFACFVIIFIFLGFTAMLVKIFFF
jgi:hypothetical protein